MAYEQRKSISEETWNFKISGGRRLMREIIGFIIWAVVGCFIIGIGISAFFRKKAVGFWANIEVESMNDIKNYNYAMGKLFIAYGVIFILLGLPILSGQNSIYIIFSILGIMVETIATMIIYTLVIEKKYKKN